MDDTSGYLKTSTSSITRNCNVNYILGNLCCGNTCQFVISRGINIVKGGYRFEFQKNLLIYPLIQEQLPHLVDHILNHRLV